MLDFYKRIYITYRGTGDSGRRIVKRYLKESLGIAEVRGDVVDEAEPLGLVQSLVVEYTSLSQNFLSQKWLYKSAPF